MSPSDLGANTVGRRTRRLPALAFARSRDARPATFGAASDRGCAGRFAQVQPQSAQEVLTFMNDSRGGHVPRARRLGRQWPGASKDRAVTCNGRYRWGVTSLQEAQDRNTGGNQNQSNAARARSNRRRTRTTRPRRGSPAIRTSAKRAAEQTRATCAGSPRSEHWRQAEPVQQPEPGATGPAKRASAGPEQQGQGGKPSRTNPARSGQCSKSELRPRRPCSNEAGAA